MEKPSNFGHCKTTCHGVDEIVREMGATWRTPISSLMAPSKTPAQVDIPSVSTLHRTREAFSG